MPGLTKVVDLELASQMMDCFDQSGLVVWGFSVEVAEVIALSISVGKKRHFQPHIAHTPVTFDLLLCVLYVFENLVVS